MLRKHKYTTRCKLLPDSLQAMLQQHSHRATMGLQHAPVKAHVAHTYRTVICSAVCNSNMVPSQEGVGSAGAAINALIGGCVKQSLRMTRIQIHKTHQVGTQNTHSRERLLQCKDINMCPQCPQEDATRHIAFLCMRIWSEHSTGCAQSRLRLVTSTVRVH